MDWACWIGGLVVGVVGLVAVLWALLWDQARGRMRCPRCWYDLTATGGERCPECGHEPRRPDRLVRTRRRWRWALVGALGVIVGVGLSETPTVRRHGWIALAPTTVLLMSVPSAGKDTHWDAVVGGRVEHPISVELRRRGAADRLFAWQWRLYSRRSRVVRARDRWPTGTFMTIAVIEPAWATTSMAIQVAMQDGTVLVNLAAGATRKRMYDLRAVPAGTSLEMRWVLGSLRSSKRICVVATIEESMQPLQGEGFDTLMTEALKVAVCHSEMLVSPPPPPPPFNRLAGEQSPIQWVTAVCTSVRLDRSVDPRLSDLADGLNIQLLCDGSVVWENRVWRPPSTGCLSYGPHNLWAPDELDRWQFRVRADEETALEDLDHGSYWRGELTVPLAAVLAPVAEVLNEPPESLAQGLRRIRRESASPEVHAAIRARADTTTQPVGEGLRE